MVFIFNLDIIGQEKIGLKDVYSDNYILYKNSDDKPFTGIAQKIRRNGHLVYEEYISKGILLKSIVYYNGKEVIPDLVIFYHDRTFTPKTEVYHNLKEPVIEYKHKDINGKLTLNEIYTNDLLTYRCEYRNGKKNGIEYCLLENGSELNIKYKNGRKVK